MLGKQVLRRTRYGVESFPHANWQSVIRPELLKCCWWNQKRCLPGTFISYIQHLALNRQKTTRHEIALWSKMVYPVACIVMVLLALPFGFFAATHWRCQC